VSDPATDAWVARVNKLALEMDELAASMHPSAWPEALKSLREKFEQVAKQGPKELRLRPTRKASKELRDLLRSALYVPLPLTPNEQASFADFLRERGVQVKVYGGLFDSGIEASEDLCPHAREWRVQRGEAAWK
jgi:hypothetical protein